MEGFKYCLIIFLTLFAGRALAVEFIDCENRNPHIYYQLLCNGVSNCDDHSDEKYCTNGRLSISKRRVYDMIGAKYIHNRILRRDQCLGPFKDTTCKEFMPGNRAINCQQCIEDIKYLYDGEVDMLHGMDETQEAKLGRMNRDYSMLKRIFYEGQWRCMKDNFISDCALIEEDKQPFLYAMPVGREPEACEDIAPEISFWKCSSTNQCIREGYPCILKKAAPCSKDFIENPVENNCQKQICPEKYWPCDGMCIKKTERCNGDCPRGRWYCDFKDKCIQHSGSCRSGQGRDMHSCIDMSMIYCNNPEPKCVPKSSYKQCGHTINCYREHKDECCDSDAEYWCEDWEKCLTRDKSCDRKCYGDRKLCISDEKCYENQEDCPEKARCRFGDPSSVDFCEDGNDDDDDDDDDDGEDDKTVTEGENDKNTTNTTTTTEGPMICEPSDPSCGVKDPQKDQSVILMIIGLSVLGLLVIIVAISIYLLMRSRRSGSPSESLNSLSPANLDTSSRLSAQYDTAHETDNEYYNRNASELYTMDVNVPNAYYVAHDQQ